MRPIPAQRIGHAHGLLKALDERGKLRLEEFVTEFTEANLFPPGLENATGRTRQFVSYARSAGLVKEERGSVELTDLGKRYVKSSDRRDIFSVSPGQAEWLRRQLREKHLTESIWNGAAIALSLYNSLVPGDWVAALDVGRSAAHLGRAGWDNEQTFRSQGERLTFLLEDMELIGPDRTLTDTGRETIGELRLPLHAALKDLATQLNPDGADGVARAAAVERDELGLGSTPDAASAVAAADPPPDQSIEAPEEDDAASTGDWVDAGAAPAPGPIEAAALAAAAGGDPIAGPDDATRSYAALTGAAAGTAGSSVAEEAAPALTAEPPPPPPGPSMPPPAAAAGAPEAEAPMDGDLQTNQTEETAMSVPGADPTEPPPPPPSPPPPPADSEGAKFPSGIRPTTAMTALRPEDLANWKATQEAAETEKAEKEPDKGAGGPFLDPAEVRAAAERRGLVIDPAVYAAAIAALASGRHLVLTGGAGSGKTALALAIAEAAVRQGRCKSVLFTSAGAGLDASDVLGRPDGKKFEAGLVPRAIDDQKWLVIDELDRVRLDEALGSVSTVLGGQPVDLPGGGELKPPAGWRMIATMADIEQVGTTTPALRRRFVFVEVPVLERSDLETLVDAWSGDDAVAAAVGRRLVAISDVVPLGPGLYRDAIAYVKARGALAQASEDDLLLEALAGFVLPQLEGEGDEIAGAAVRAAGFAT